jgi:MATE family multidrug resistance protein
VAVVLPGEFADCLMAAQVEIPIIFRMSLPCLFTQLAEWSLVLASVVSIGHLGTAQLAASS